MSYCKVGSVKEVIAGDACYKVPTTEVVGLVKFSCLLRLSAASRIPGIAPENSFAGELLLTSDFS
jgi:hypothetical protein